MNNLIQETAERNNISIDMIHDGLAGSKQSFKGSFEAITKSLGDTND